MLKKYQQGDVLFHEVPKNLWEFKEEVVEYSKKEDIDNVRTKTISKMKPIKDGKYNYSSAVDEKDRLEKSGDSLTVAFGEVTGHSHTFRNQLPEVNIISYGKTFTSVGDTPRYIKIKGNDAIITHEEHNPLTITPGHYKISIVREWDHIGAFSRNVVD
tara:strand:+ start:19011 stop:19484 length:474 start_codon:yes stop_codon:yes gene_type:complete